MNNFFSKGSLERIFVACAALIVMTSVVVFYVIYVVKMPLAVHQTMMRGQPPKFVATFDWQDWQPPDEQIRSNHQSEYITEHGDDFEVRRGVLQTLCYEVHVIQARGVNQGVASADMKFLDGTHDEVRLVPKSRTIAGLAGALMLMWAAMLMWVIKAIQKRRQMLEDGTAEPV